MAVELTIRLRADGRSLTGALKSGGSAVQSYGRQLDVAKAKSMRLATSTSSLTSSLRGLRSLLPALGLAVMVRESVRAAESLRSMDARVRRATASLGDYVQVQRELYEISQRNGNQLVETANLFISINRAAEDLGRSRKDVLDLTNTIQQLGVISGASGEAMKNSLRQFSQSMAGGVVRAEEFNSIIENTPEIAARMASGLGMSVGQLRLAVVEGKVLSEDVFDSLLSQSDQIESDFSRMPLTIGRAWTALTNSMSLFIASANDASGATSGIAGGIKAVSAAIDDMNQKVESGQLKQEFTLWINLMSDVGAQVDWLKSKFSELMPQNSGLDFAWSDFFKDLPAVMTIAFTEIFGVVDRGISHIAMLWQKLPLEWDLLWLNIKTKTQEWWIQIRSLFESSVSFSTAEELAAASMAALQAEYSRLANAITGDLREIERHQQVAADASKATVRAIRDEQHARMDQRRGMVEVNAALEGLISNNSELFGVQSAVGRQVRETTTAIDEQTDATTNLTTSGRDLYKSMFDVTTINLKKSFEENARAIDETTDSIFDMDEALKQVQNNIQQGFSDLFVDLFSGKGVDSFKDFATRVLDIFKRLLADMAAAWIASEVFKIGGVNFGGGGSDIVSSIIGGGSKLGSVINGGGIGGGIGSGAGGSAIFKAISTGVSKGIGAIKGVFGGGGPTAVSGAAGSSMTLGSHLMGAAPVLAIGAYGFAAQRRAEQQRLARQQEFFSQVGTGTSEQMGDGAWDFRGMLNDAEAFFSTTRAGWQSTIEALSEAGVLTKGWGAMLDENGKGLVKIQGDIDGVKTALSGAAATGFHFGGSLTNAIEKGNSLAVSIQGDSEIISTALNAATAMGIGGFRNLEMTATGVTATLTGDIESWDDYLQRFVNESVRSAISGVGTLGSQAATATSRFLDLAKAAAGVRVPGGSTINIPQHRDGKDYVPHDGYLAMLHKGERVLTAAQNREYSSGGDVRVMTQENPQSVRLLSEQNELLRKLLKANRTVERTL